MLRRMFLSIVTAAAVAVGAGILMSAPAQAAPQGGNKTGIYPGHPLWPTQPLRPHRPRPPFYRDPFFWRFDDPFFWPRPVPRVRCGWRRACRFVPRRLRVWSERRGRWVWRKVYVKKCRKVRICRPYRRW